MRRLNTFQFTLIYRTKHIGCSFVEDICCSYWKLKKLKTYLGTEIQKKFCSGLVVNVTGVMKWCQPSGDLSINLKMNYGQKASHCFQCSFYLFSIMSFAICNRFSFFSRFYDHDLLLTTHTQPGGKKWRKRVEYKRKNKNSMLQSSTRQRLVDRKKTNARQINKKKPVLHAIGCSGFPRSAHSLWFCRQVLSEILGQLVKRVEIQTWELSHKVFLVGLSKSEGC